jgi:hypothetical protein
VLDDPVHYAARACAKGASMLIGIDELWAPVPDFPGYEVSNLGGIRSCCAGKTWRPLKGEIDKDGYKRVTLYRDRKPSKFPLHRLVAICFVAGRTPERDIAAHRNGDNSNNAASNLKWATQAENIADKVAHGTHQIGSKHGRATIDEKVASEIKRLFDEIPKYRGKLQEIAARTGASYQVVSGIVHKGGWRHA